LSRFCATKRDHDDSSLQAELAAAPIRPERNVENSIATIRRQLTIALARTLTLPVPSLTITPILSGIIVTQSNYPTML
jgi:hypothetical protein